MADISSIILPGGGKYDLKDKNAAPNSAGIYFGICSTDSNVNAKTVTISNITQLYDGLSIRVLFENGFTGEDTYSTLNLNNLGAKIIFTKTNNFLINNILSSYSIMDLVYYNNYWYALDKGIATTNIFGLTALNDDPTSYSILRAASSKSVKTVYDNMLPVYGMGKNLLDNWYFLGTGSQNGQCKYPINQRGKTTYTGSMDICIDRWHLTNSVVTATLQSTGLRVVTADSLSYSAGIQQKIYASNIPNGVYTLSVLTTTGLNTCQATIDANDNNWRGGSSTAGCWVAVRYMSLTGTFDFNITARDTTIIAAKFEYGSKQTLCHNEGTAASPVWVLNQLPDFREELAKCQYYFWAPKVYSSSEDHGICYGHAISTTLGQFYIYLPQMMNPSITPSFVGSVPRVWRTNNNTNANASAINSIIVDGNILCLAITIGTVTLGEGLRLINTRGSIFGIAREI